MTTTATLAAGGGLLLDPAVLRSAPVAVLSAFVAINTVMYVVLAVLKVLPKVHLGDRVGSRGRRVEDRGVLAGRSAPAVPADAPAAEQDRSRVSI